MPQRKKDYLRHRLSYRISENEYQWLSKIARQGGFPTVTDCLRALIHAGINEVLLSRLDAERARTIEQETKELFAECERRGLLEWPGNIAKRK